MVAKPTKPSNNLPSSFGGTKENFSASKIESGYEPDVPDILGGANLNYMLDTLGKKETYYDTICDYINATPINKTPIVNANNQLVYTQYDIRVYDATETYFEGDFVTGKVDNVKHIYKSLQNNNVGKSLSNTDYWEKTDIISDVKTIGRNIGEIIPSTIPLTDAGLHLLDGSLIEGSGIYSDFVDYIASIYDASLNYFCTEVQWQTSVSTYGSCGKFVYNSVNNTVRLPKVSNILEGTTDVSALGNLTEAGLPSIGATTFVKSVTSANADGLPSGAEARSFINTATVQNVSSIYGKSNTVQPQTIKCLYYIVVATSQKTDIEVDIDEIATDLNGKCDADGTNATFAHIVETYVNGTSWYRVYSDGWCEQGGHISNYVTPTSIQFLKTYASTDTVNVTFSQVSTANNQAICLNAQPTTTGFAIFRYNGATTLPFVTWQACGYIS